MRGGVRVLRAEWCAVLLGLALAGCASGPPPRYVLERDLGDWAYRRYQKTLDVEFPMEGTTATGYTASYILHGSGREGRVRVATAFITVYEGPMRGFAAEIKERLASLSSYEVGVDKMKGQWVWTLRGGEDHWIMWVSGKRLVKLGSATGQVPEAIADAYLHEYRSDLDAYGRAKKDTPSYGKSKRELEESESEEPPMPSNLRQGTGR